MSNSNQRRARQQAEREEWERQRQEQATARRRRATALGAMSVLVAVVVIVGLVAVLTRGDVEEDTAASEPQTQDIDLLEEEKAGEAQASAASAAREAGEVTANDFTVEPGTAVSGREKPLPDDRRVACGAKAPTSARAARPTFPGGPAQVLEAGVDYVARIETSCGPIVIDLLENETPVAVNSFVFLAREGFYDGLEVYRDYGAISAVQTGSGDNAVGWDIGYQLPDELGRAERTGYPIGSVTTAGQGPYTAGSDFYIVYGDEFEAGFESNRMHTMFGRVLNGMDVIDTMTAMERIGMGGEAFAQRLLMNSVTIEER